MRRIVRLLVIFAVLLGGLVVSEVPAFAVSPNCGSGYTPLQSARTSDNLAKLQVDISSDGQTMCWFLLSLSGANGVNKYMELQVTRDGAVTSWTDYGTYKYYAGPVYVPNPIGKCQFGRGLQTWGGSNHNVYIDDICVFPT